MQQCDCGNEAALKQCKNGKPENVGKWFWCCEQGKDKGCKFFKWTQFANNDDEPVVAPKKQAVQLPPKNSPKQTNNKRKRTEEEAEQTSNEKGVALTLLAEKILRLEQDVQQDRNQQSDWQAALSKNVQLLVDSVDYIEQQLRKQKPQPKEDACLSCGLLRSKHTGVRHIFREAEDTKKGRFGVPPPATPPREARESTPDVQMEEGEIPTSPNND